MNPFPPTSFISYDTIIFSLDLRQSTRVNESVAIRFTARCSLAWIQSAKSISQEDCTLVSFIFQQLWSSKDSLVTMQKKKMGEGRSACDHYMYTVPCCWSSFRPFRGATELGQRLEYSWELRLAAAAATVATGIGLVNNRWRNNRAMSKWLA